MSFPYALLNLPQDPFTLSSLHINIQNTVKRGTKDTDMKVKGLWNCSMKHHSYYRYWRSYPEGKYGLAFLITILWSLGYTLNGEEILKFLWSLFLRCYRESLRWLWVFGIDDSNSLGQQDM